MFLKVCEDYGVMVVLTNHHTRCSPLAGYARMSGVIVEAQGVGASCLCCFNGQGEE